MCRFAELSQVMETLEPRGLYLSVSEVPSREAAEHMLADLEKWAAHWR